MLDDRLPLRTPEGGALNLVPAGPAPRTAAFAVDLLIRGVIYLAAMLLLGFLGAPATGAMLILFFLLEWFYPALFEYFGNGQTPGKKSLGLAVVHSDGTPLTFNGSLIRNLLRTADLFPAFYLAGFLSMLCSRRFQRLGDLAADTLVIHLDRAGARPATPAGPTQAPDWAVSLDDQRILVSFLERGTRLSAARRAELALLAYPELGEGRAEARALAHARYLLGEK